MKKEVVIGDSGLKQSAVTLQLPRLTREVLAGIGKRGWVAGDTRRYSSDQIRVLYSIYRCYEAGLTTEAVSEVLRDPAKFYPADSAAFSEAVSRLLENVLDDDPAALVRCVVIEAVRILRTECALLFLEPETWPGRLRMAAGCVYGGSFSQVHDVNPGRGYADWLARGMKRRAGPNDISADATPRAQWRDLSIEDVENRFTSQFDGFPTATHLPSKKYYSWLCLPLTDRKKHTVGYLVAENRLGPRGTPGEAFCFDPATEVLGKTYAAFLSHVLQIVPLVMTQERLFKQAVRFRPEDAFLKEVVRIGILLTRGFRGELAVYDPGRGMVVRARRGPTKPAGGKKQFDPVLPNRSVARDVYETGLPQRLDDISKSDLYFPCHDKTLSQITVPLPFPFSNRPYGTLTIESHREKSFDAKDQKNLEQLAAQAGSYANSVEKNAAITELLERFYESKEVPPECQGELSTILDDVYRALGFTSGIVYLADYRAARLRISGTRRCPNVVAEKVEKMWRFSDKSLATKVFLEQRAVFAEDPTNSLYVSRTGLEAFGIGDSTLLGVPITFQRFIVGVLVVWSDGPPMPKETDAERLKPFTELLVASRRSSNKVKMWNGLQKIQASIRSGAPRDEVFMEILQSLLTRFDRSKLHQLKEDPADGKGPYFECLLSVGDEKLNTFQHQKIYVSESPYLRRILGTPSSEAIPHVFDNNELGPDPCAHRWGRGADQGWAIAFLFAHRKLWGYLAVDNAYTSRPFDHAETEELLSWYGWLGELAVVESGG